MVTFYNFIDLKEVYLPGTKICSKAHALKLLPYLLDKLCFFNAEVLKLY